MAKRKDHVWFKYRLSDRRRFRRERLELYTKRHDEVKAIEAKLYSPEGEEMDLYALADIAEEEGMLFLAVFYRNNLTTKKPKWIKSTFNKRKKR